MRAACQPPARISAAVPPHAPALIPAAAVVERIRLRLCHPDPVDAQGVAMIYGLLTDTTSTLYQPSDPARLTLQLRAAAAALELFG